MILIKNNTNSKELFHNRKIPFFMRYKKMYHDILLRALEGENFQSIGEYFNIPAKNAEVIAKKTAYKYIKNSESVQGLPTMKTINSYSFFLKQKVTI